jgi:hypothetical protein
MPAMAMGLSFFLPSFYHCTTLVIDVLALYIHPPRPGLRLLYKKRGGFRQLGGTRVIVSRAEFQSSRPLH